MSLKVLLITADANMHKLHVGSYTRSFREAPLSLTTLAFNFLGDGLRDAFDPRQKNR